MGAFEIMFFFSVAKTAAACCHKGKQHSNRDEIPDKIHHKLQIDEELIGRFNNHLEEGTVTTRAIEI